jgi:CRP-like cAMP-binding protein
MFPDQSSTSNLLLRALSPEDYALLNRHLQRVPLELGKSLFEANEPIELVYFPEGGVCSIVSVQDSGEMVEVGMFGFEGMSGSSVVLGAGQTPHKSMVQVNGSTSLVILSADLVTACSQSVGLHTLLLRYTQGISVQAAHTAAANAHFALPERLARWLLMCEDRVQSPQISLTHEYMSTMLAVRRSGVTVTLHTLEGTGAIRSTRGLVTILNRSRLEEIAGESYGAPEAEYRRLIGPFAQAAP